MGFSHKIVHVLSKCTDTKTVPFGLVINPNGDVLVQMGCTPFFWHKLEKKIVEKRWKRKAKVICSKNGSRETYLKGLHIQSIRIYITSEELPNSSGLLGKQRSETWTKGKITKLKERHSINNMLKTQTYTCEESWWHVRSRWSQREDFVTGRRWSPLSGHPFPAVNPEAGGGDKVMSCVTGHAFVPLHCDKVAFEGLVLLHR